MEISPQSRSPAPSKVLGPAIAFLLTPLDESTRPRLGDPVIEITRQGIRAGIHDSKLIPVAEAALAPLGSAIQERVRNPGDHFFVQSDGQVSRGGPADITGEWFTVGREKSVGEVTLNRYEFSKPGKVDTLKLAFDNAMTLSTIFRDVAPLVSAMPPAEIAAAHGGTFHHGPARVLEMRNPTMRRSAPAPLLEATSLEDDLRVAEDATGKVKELDGPDAT